MAISKPKLKPKEPKKPTWRKRSFNAEGSGYDYVSAKKAGIKPDKTGHMPSRVPKTGLLLKGRKHPTFRKTLGIEHKLGYIVYKKGKRYYSKKRSDMPQYAKKKSGK